MHPLNIKEKSAWSGNSGELKRKEGRKKIKELLLGAVIKTKQHGAHEKIIASGKVRWTSMEDVLSDL